MSKAKLRLMMPFHGWMVSGRGIYKFFPLAKLFDAIKERNRYNNQRTKCFCPYCDNELCGSDSHIDLMNDINRFEYYKCSNCKEYSTWDFDSYTLPIHILPI